MSKELIFKTMSEADSLTSGTDYNVICIWYGLPSSLHITVSKTTDMGLHGDAVFSRSICELDTDANVQDQCVDLIESIWELVK